jgi:hypothetical protein
LLLARPEASARALGAVDSLQLSDGVPADPDDLRERADLERRLAQALEAGAMERQRDLGRAAGWRVVAAELEALAAPASGNSGSIESHAPV